MTRPRRVAALAERGFEPVRGLGFPYTRLTTATLVKDALEEDCASNDITTLATIVSDRRARCVIVARESGVIAGIPLVREAFRQRDARVSVRSVFRDGRRVEAGTPLIFITGHARGLLSAERVALNFLQKLSGIASLTARYVDAIKGTSARILDTRKTTPGWRRLEKYAVRAGGGMNHRMDLSAAVLIKDNHLTALGGDVELAVQRVIVIEPVSVPDLIVSRRRGQTDCPQVRPHDLGKRERALTFVFPVQIAVYRTHRTFPQRRPRTRRDFTT